MVSWNAVSLDPWSLKKRRRQNCVTQKVSREIRKPPIGVGWDWHIYDWATHRTVTSLLGEESFITASRHAFGVTHLADASVHALGHVIVLGTLGPRDKQQLQFQFADLVRGATLRRRASRALLALDAARLLFDGPFVEASDVDGVWSPKGMLLMITECHVRPSEATITGNETPQPVPHAAIDIFTLLLLRGELLLHLQLLALAGGGKHSAERRGFLLGWRRRRSRLRGSEPLIVNFHLQSQLKFQVVLDDELEFLSNRSGLPQLKPSRGHTMQTIIQGKGEVRPLACKSPKSVRVF